MDQSIKVGLAAAFGALTGMTPIWLLIRNDLKKSQKRSRNIYHSAVNVMERIQQGEYIDKPRGTAVTDYEFGLIVEHEKD